MLKSQVDPVRELAIDMNKSVTSAPPDRGSAIYQLTMLALSVYVLLVLLLEMWISDHEVKELLQYIDLAVCAVFLMDFFLNLYKAERKLEYLRWGWIDLISSIPILDPLRWGRLARVVRILRYLRAVRSFRVLYRGILASRFESLTLVVLLIVFFSFTVCTAVILDSERDDPNSQIKTAEQALWWSFLNVMNAKTAIDQTATNSAAIATIVLNKVGLLVFAYINSLFIAWLLGAKNGRITVE